MLKKEMALVKTPVNIVANMMTRAAAAAVPTVIVVAAAVMTVTTTQLKTLLSLQVQSQSSVRR